LLVAELEKATFTGVQQKSAIGDPHRFCLCVAPATACWMWWYLLLLAGRRRERIELFF
jgi:hypothetical protein